MPEYPAPSVLSTSTLLVVMISATTVPLTLSPLLVPNPAVSALLVRPRSPECVLVAKLVKNLLLVVSPVIPAPAVFITLPAAMAPSLTNANAVTVAAKQMLKRQVALHALQAHMPPGLALLFVFLLTPLSVLTALMEDILLLVPQDAHLVPVVLRRMVLELVARSAVLVLIVPHTALEVAKYALLVLLPRLALIVALPAAPVNILLPMPAPAPSALWTPTPAMLDPPPALLATLALLL